MLVALTGGFGTGKSTVLDIFRSLGVPVLSADQEVHELLTRDDIKTEIRGYFGEGVFTDGEINRNELARVVFKSKEKRRWLERLLHPEVFKRIDAFGKENSDRIAIVEIPLLYEIGAEGRFDKVVVVIAGDEQVRKRLARKGLTMQEIQQRQSAQLPIEGKKARADFVIDNSDGLKETERQVKEILKELEDTI